MRVLLKCRKRGEKLLTKGTSALDTTVAVKGKKNKHPFFSIIDYSFIEYFPKNLRPPLGTTPLRNIHAKTSHLSLNKTNFY
jgi:hypothetical protein